jgi:signal transduction histidine kinase
MEITERKQAGEALQLAQAQLADRAGELEKLVAERTAELTATNHQLEAFIYSIAHDLRAPLRSMQGFAAMLVAEAGAALNEAGRDYAERLNKSTQFMDALIRDLLAFSRISQQSVQLTSVNLKPVVETVLSRLEKEIQEKNARVESSGPWPVVLAHEPTLAQVVFNLVSNALKFVTADGPPQIRLRTEERSEGLVDKGITGSAGNPPSTHPPIHSSPAAPPPASWVRVWVEDNGPGIASDHQGQIFRLFTRLDGDKFAGTGIGLAVVQKGVERMGGRAGVESAPGEGSRFWFELKNSPPGS